MDRKIIMMACAVLLLGGLLATFLLNDSDPPSMATAAGPSAPSASKRHRSAKSSDAGPYPKRPRRRPSTWKKDSRTVIPPLKRPQSRTTAKQDDELDSEGMVDKRENPPPGSDALFAAVNERMSEVREHIKECINAWMEHEPGLSGRVVVGLSLGADGLEEAWVQDHTDIPFGPRTCFSSAIYAVDWSDISEDSLMVTFPFVVVGADEDGDQDFEGGPRADGTGLSD